MSKFDTPPRRVGLREMHRQEQVMIKQARTQLFNVTLTPTSVAANSTSTQDFDVSGVSSGDQVIVKGPTQPDGIMVGQAAVPGINQASITFANVTAGPVVPASGTYEIRAMR